VRGILFRDLERALSALREITEHSLYAGHPFQQIARAAIAEIEGEAKEEL
jgi:hypothetical protein